MMAAIMVDEIAIPKLPKINEIANSDQFSIKNDSKRTEYKKVITVFIKNTNSRLNRSLPLYTIAGAAIICKVKVVPLSSSETNALAKPDIAEKNITTHKSPPVK